MISRDGDTALMLAIAMNNDEAVKVLLDRGATAHVKVLDPTTIVVSAGDLKSKPLPQLRLHVGEKITEGEWFPANKRAIVRTTGWGRPTDVHFRHMLALLKAAGAKK